MQLHLKADQRLRAGQYSKVYHNRDVIMGATASQITSLTIVY